MVVGAQLKRSASQATQSGRDRSLVRISAEQLRGVERHLGCADHISNRLVGRRQGRRAGGRNAGVCDNLLQVARKSLILKTERCPSGCPPPRRSRYGATSRQSSR